MPARPFVSIVVPVYNDEQTLVACLESCLSQTLSDIEIICIDDASTDASADIVTRIAHTDHRVRLIRLNQNRTALHARRLGVEAAAADHVLFLDGDDELVPEAADLAWRQAQRSGADLVGFGIFVVDPHGRTGGAYEQRLRPKHDALQGPEVVRGLFPQGKPAQGQLWRHLYRTEVVRQAYALIPDDTALARMNDLPLMFLVAALSNSYVSLPERLYRYHFGRGGSGHHIEDVARVEFYVSGIDSIDAIADAVEIVADRAPDPDAVRAAYESARTSIIAYICDQIARSPHPELRAAGLDRVYESVAPRAVARAVAAFYPAALDALREHGASVPLEVCPVRNVMLVARTLTTGGISNVLSAQARILRDAGHRVTIVLRGSMKDRSLVPTGVDVHELSGRRRAEKYAEWIGLIVEREVDAVLDHEILSGLDWHEYAALSRAAGVPTIGWIHNFALRPLHDGTARIGALRESLPLLRTVVTLSPLDVALWKSLGIANVVHLPNPPSPMLLDTVSAPADRQAPRGRIELVWLGRLEEHTKQCLDLIRVGEELSQRGVDFRLTAVGPDWIDLTARSFNSKAAKAGLADRVRAVGPLQGRFLVAALDRADVFLSTSAIEGYQLTIAEAQSRGLPVCMYALPWLPLVRGNGGIVSVPQRDAVSLAEAVIDLVSDPQRYERMSRESVAAAERATAHDYGRLYEALLADDLPAEFSPEPTETDLRALLELAIGYAEPRSDKLKKSRQANDKQRLLSLGRRIVHRVPALRPLAENVRRILVRI
ncbi:glycosyltransferase [Microbacterium sp. ARD32]|uniref:glycosyltransferase n=1 Tax=Microbacterium sp. ARD32 TaxID=2962577 RepID=UPI002882A717|nr:glycosyltransferase [Microbacterium sp. ARD32]MDT0156405.1 glycosyltransferase [Microbacterium sp. ARD32]